MNAKRGHLDQIPVAERHMVQEERQLPTAVSTLEQVCLLHGLTEPETLANRGAQYSR
jgi:hypothetical protein